MKANLISRFATACTLMVLSGAALATDPPATLADLTGGISFTTAAAAVLAVALVVIGFKVVKQGALIVISMITKAR
jgi:hypothetical protein